MKFLKKINKISSVFKSSKDLDPFFFELLMDSIRDSNKNLILKKESKALFIIYSNIFATKKLNLPLPKEKTLGVKINKVNDNIALSSSTVTQKSAVKPGFIDKQLGCFLLKKTLFYNLYLNRYNELPISQVINYVKIIQSLDKI